MAKNAKILTACSNMHCKNRVKWSGNPAEIPFCNECKKGKKNSTFQKWAEPNSRETA